MPIAQAFKLNVVRQAPDTIHLEWKIAPGYYLYRERIKLTSLGKDVTPALLGQPIVKDDPSFGSVEIFHDHLEAVLSGEIAADTATDLLTVSYQGCQEGGICYPPATRRIDPISLAVIDNAATRVVTSTATEWRAPAASENTAIVLAADEGGMVGSLLKDGGIGLVLGSFLLFGIVLAFTPCVFPMYPILAGIIVRAGDRASPMRSLVLSATYVLAMSTAFGLLGIAAAWSGQNLQVVLQSPPAILAVSVMFAVLALSMFGLYELQLPSRWVNGLSRVGQGGQSSLASAGLLGFTAALIVGPCVTAPLAGALLYIAQTGDVALGAAALFVLGIGKGIPLMVFGTIGQKALPRAGAWMETVKQSFGLIFMATAIWMLSRIVPGQYVLALWSVLLIASGV